MHIFGVHSHTHICACIHKIHTPALKHIRPTCARAHAYDCVCVCVCACVCVCERERERESVSWSNTPNGSFAFGNLTYITHRYTLQQRTATTHCNNALQHTQEANHQHLRRANSNRNLSKVSMYVQKKEQNPRGSTKKCT